MMDPDSDEDDTRIRSLTIKIDPLRRISIAHNMSARNSNRHRANKAQKNVSSDRQVEETILPAIANTGDIIQLSDGTRKKYNGSSWRRMCSKPNCSYYSQSSGLCKPHLAAMKKRQSVGAKESSKTDDETLQTEELNSKQTEPQKGDILVLSNGIRKKFDGRQYRRICADSSCTTVVHGSLEYQRGLCPHHYQEHRHRNLSQSDSLIENSTSSNPSLTVSSERKRRRAQSPTVVETKSSFLKSNHRLSIAKIPPSVDIQNPKKGDIIQMENGSRKKFDGVVWRKICSLPDCFIAAQRDELCRKHFIKLNGKPTNSTTKDMLNSVSMVPPVSKSFSSMSMSSLDERMGFQDLKKSFESSQEEQTTDQLSNFSDQDLNESNDIDHEDLPMIDDNPFTAHIDHSLINALSASRQKFPTQYLKKWLREHRTHPYPTNQEKLELAKQSSITYDQVTTWFNNARAILRRRQAKLRQSFDRTCEDEQELDDQIEQVQDLNSQAELNSSIASRIHRNLPLFNGVCYRSIGIQCNPSTANQSTSISTSDIVTMNDNQLESDRHIRIVRPSSPLMQSLAAKRARSQELTINGIKCEEDDSVEQQRIIVTSTCLDDDQMARLKEFCSRFQLEFSHAVDERTTHLITDEEEGETLVCPLSKKVIQAVARHMYIISYRWIDVCLQMNKIVNEKSFEIQGDLTLSSDHHGMQRSRQSILPKTLPPSFLLENFLIMIKCDGCQEMMNTDELIELVQLSGAKYTTDSHISRSQTGITRIVLCEKEYLMHRKEMYEKCIRAGVHFLTPEWFLESLVQYRIQPFQEYQITP